jgi:hypothetical protein
MHHTRRRHHSARSALIVTLVLAAGSLLGSASADAVTKTPFDTNLVKNPGAEGGTATDGNSHVAIPHWKTSEEFTVVRYGAPGFPTKSESTRMGGGKKFFSCGQNASSGYAEQDIQLHGRKSLIVNGHVKVILKARLAVYDSQHDTATAAVFFSSASGFIIGSFETASVEASDGVFIAKSASHILPAGTALITVQMSGQRANNGGTYCDAYFDNISAVLKLV